MTETEALGMTFEDDAERARFHALMRALGARLGASS